MRSPATLPRPVRFSKRLYHEDTTGTSAVAQPGRGALRVFGVHHRADSVLYSLSSLGREFDFFPSQSQSPTFLICLMFDPERESHTHLSLQTPTSTLRSGGCTPALGKQADWRLSRHECACNQTGAFGQSIEAFRPDCSLPRTPTSSPFFFVTLNTFVEGGIMQSHALTALPSQPSAMGNAQKQNRQRVSQISVDVCAVGEQIGRYMPPLNSKSPRRGPKSGSAKQES